MHYYVLQRDAQSLLYDGHESVVHIPFVLRGDGYYPAELNRYLRTRSLAEWRPHLGHGALDTHGRIRLLTRESSRALANRLATFFRWCERTGRDWRTVTYREDLLSWQRGLLDGTASESGCGLGSSRVNNLVNEACFFLTWASETPTLLGPAIRESLRVPTNIKRKKIALGRGGGDEALVQQRVGELPVRRSQFHLPSEKEIGHWMKYLRARFTVKSLMCELILETGIRIHECNEWRLDTLPPREKWKVRAGKIPVWIEHGIKGPKIFPNSTRSTKPRNILVPLNLADEIDHYRNVTRRNQLRRWILAGHSPEERQRRAFAPKTDRLWLSEASNQPFADQQLYQAWVSTPYCPKDWHPHKGRHYFAVNQIVEWIRNDLAARHNKSVPELTWLQGTMRDAVKLILSPLLGHCSDETTMLYLKAAHIRILEEFEHPALRWQKFCDQGDES